MPHSLSLNTDEIEEVDVDIVDPKPSGGPPESAKDRKLRQTMEPLQAVIAQLQQDMLERTKAEEKVYSFVFLYSVFSVIYLCT